MKTSFALILSVSLSLGLCIPLASTAMTPKAEYSIKPTAKAFSQKIKPLPSAHQSFKITDEQVNKIAFAIYRAEGKEKAKKPYGILSIRVSSKAEAERVCKNTIRNNYQRWLEAGRKEHYLTFLARRYAPIGANNDPKKLNKNWLKNVTKFYNETRSNNRNT